MSAKSGYGISGRVAEAFITSKLTPLIVVAALLLGAFAVVVTPREEEPQIVVPMIDVMVGYPGATAAEVESRVTDPMERLLSEIDGVEYVYSIASPGRNLTIVRFYVGEDMEDSLVKLYTKLMANYDVIPPGVTPPLVRARSIDDVPILSVTLHGGGLAGYDLRRVAEELRGDLKQDRDVSEITVTGGQRRQVRVVMDPTRLAANGLSPAALMGALQATNRSLQAGSFPAGNAEFMVEAGGFLENAEDVGAVVVGVRGGRPVLLRNVTTIYDGPEEPASYVLTGGGGVKGLEEAVTIAVAKKKGTNATHLAERTLGKIETLRGSVIPSDVETTVTRNYGETAREKSDELLKHMLIATVSVVFLIALTLGWRESAVVAVAVPVTLALTLLINYLFGYTLNRVTLFALIFSIGILVDDAIVVVENIHRHFKISGASILTAIMAVDEVGNPTILATFTVIAALMPMAFVSGLMGPYMAPIPIGASAAMVFSLLVAFIVSPWLGYLVLRKAKHTGVEDEDSRGLAALYRRIMEPMVARPSLRYGVLAAVGVLLLLALALVPLKAVAVKMLPFDNKNELQVVIDMPEGTPLEATASVAREMAAYVGTVPEVEDYQVYVGTSAPFNFNGLVRHYYLRQQPEAADIQVNFAPKQARAAQSHAIAKRMRPPLVAIAARYGANVKVAEIPPGPPVLSTLVAEIYGPDLDRQREIASQVKGVFNSTEGVVDVDWLVEDAQPKLTLDVDREKAALAGVSVGEVAENLAMSLGGTSAGLVHIPGEREPVEILLRMPVAERSGLASLKDLRIPSRTGALVPLGELVTARKGTIEKSIHHKNLKRVVYVTGEVAGTEESPVYAIMKMKEKVRALNLPEGYELQQLYSTQPRLDERYAMKWDGEMHITYEVFRDLGIAFGAVLVLIYILVVAWFRSFVTPLVIMSPIPLTLVGILPGHWIFGAFFTATSMIGFIALAGIIVRNSILLVDFIEMEWAAGVELKTAIIRAGAVRFRPIALTALAVVVGSFVMLFDPIFQGLAIAMMFGAVAATGLTLVAVPLVYYEAMKGKPAPGTEGESPAAERPDEH